MVLFGFVFALRVLFFSFFMVLFGFLFRRVFVIYPPEKEKEKGGCRLDMKNLAFGFKIIRSNKSEEFVLFVVCELYFSLCLIS